MGNELKANYDAIVVGGGHNGLVAAGYLQRAGLQTLVLERRYLVGGACVTEEVFPGYKVSTTSYVCSLLRPEIIRDLELKRYGYEIIERSPSSFSPFPDKRYLMFWRDAAKTQAEIAKFSKKDAIAFPQFEQKLEDLSKFVQPLLMQVPPDPTANSFGDVLNSLKLMMRMRAIRSELYDHLRVFSMSVAEYLDQWFESEAVKVRMATDGIIGAWAGPYSPGTAYVLFHHVMGETEGKPGVWGYVRGGMGGLTQALAKSFEAQGGTILTNAEVARIDVKNGIAGGVVLSDGREFRAKRILSNCDPKRTFLGLLPSDSLPSEFLDNIRAFRMKSGTVKINVALKELPDFSACPGKQAGPQHRGTIHIAPTMDYIERAFEDAKQGRPSEYPSIEMTIPSVVDDTLAPEGKHVASLFVQYAPYKRRDGKEWNDTTKKEFAERNFEILNSYAPNFRESVEDFQVLTPVDLEREYGLTEGNIMHGEMTLDQMFFMRPLAKYAKFKTPIRNLYMCGAGAHPGGGVMGAPGYIAAQTVIKENRGLLSLL
ncbi:MAG: NAD(P)/FAD-dependent oxidoreductase [Bdellovibrionales bacterium]|nr:NAD(P)/FAD-dependent oxidoreductase [Bdellovibrionales bacterium]